MQNRPQLLFNSFYGLTGSGAVLLLTIRFFRDNLSLEFETITGRVCLTYNI